MWVCICMYASSVRLNENINEVFFVCFFATRVTVFRSIIMASCNPPLKSVKCVIQFIPDRLIMRYCSGAHITLTLIANDHMWLCDHAGGGQKNVAVRGSTTNWSLNSGYKTEFVHNHCFCCCCLCVCSLDLWNRQRLNKAVCEFIRALIWGYVNEGILFAIERQKVNMNGKHSDYNNSGWMIIASAYSRTNNGE